MTQILSLSIEAQNQIVSYSVFDQIQRDSKHFADENDEDLGDYLMRDYDANPEGTFAALFLLSCLFIYLFLKSENKKQKKNLSSHLWVICSNSGELQIVKYDNYKPIKTDRIELIGTIEEANKFYFKNYIQNLS